MTLKPPAKPPVSRRFDPERMFKPGSVAVSGCHTPLGAKLLANIQAGGFRGQVGHDDAPIDNADLAIVADATEHIAAALQDHAGRGVKGAFVLSPVRELRALAKAAGIRVLGPYSFGMMLPGLGLNASALPVMPAAGKVAYVGQSGALVRTVLDWAVPNFIGFSQIIGIGGNTDMGFGLVLDHLSRDAGTNAIMIEIDRVRDPQMFHSAVRAAARLRPVVALVPGITLRDAAGMGRAAAEAAFTRSGVLLTATMSEFLAAAETLTRVKPAHGGSLAIISNSVAAGRLAADDALNHGLTLTQLSPETRQVLALSLGLTPQDIPATGPIFTGRGSNPTRLADVAALLSSAHEVGGILLVHAPSGEGDEVAVEALIACAKTVKIPLLIAAMGEASGLIHRHRLAQAGLACFDTPEAAIAGFRHLIRNRANRAAARELPPSKVLKVAPDTATVQAKIASARAAGRSQLVQDEALALVAAYKVPVIKGGYAATPEEAALVATTIGYPVVIKLSHPNMPANRTTGSIALDVPDGKAVRAAAKAMDTTGLSGAKFLVQKQARRGVQLRIRVADSPQLGPTIGFGVGGGDRDDVSSLAVDLPPLNLPLAHALIARSGVAPQLAAHRGAPAADLEAIAATLVRVSQLIIDTPEILLLDLDPIFANEDGVVAVSGRISLRQAGEIRTKLVISPYPAELTTHYEAKGHKFTLRPIRPEDADAHAALFSRMPAEDMRYRFFSSVRQLAPEQIARLTDIDYGREMAIIAVNEATGETAGAARLVRNDTDGRTAEFACAVEPAAKGIGLATALMRAIIAWGKSQGVEEISGTILSDNAPMLAFIKSLGFSIERSPDDHDVVEARLVP